MIHRDYCQLCKRTNIPLHKHRKLHDYYEYWCRECNRERQRIYRATRAGKLAAARARDNSNTKFPEKLKARQLVRAAVRNGNITKPSNCDICGSEQRLQGHHPDYREPLRVIWLCSGCHANIHLAAEAVHGMTPPAQAEPAK